MTSQISQILNTSEAKWMIARATIEVPYPDEFDYTETTFTGNLPYHMANKIKAAAAKFLGRNKDGDYCLNENTDTNSRSLRIKFGKTFKTSTRIMFFYTNEKL